MIKPIKEMLLDLVYPPYHPCPHCFETDIAIKGETGSLCPSCFKSFPFLRKEENPPNVQALAHYHGAAQSLVHRLKYKEALYLAKPMANLMLQHLEPKGSSLVIPVPMHQRRQRQRGYNQAERLARHIARMVELECETNAMIRNRETEPMYRLNRLQRIQNMWNSITVRETERYRIRNQKILLVDDVYTTGATAQACIRSLKEAGAEGVTVITFALADITPS
ncbi:ComF family protein [Tindallia californiensis]|uniref:ComF family protein n=1 Tax=Tindallia californiensis TaxID=159292 RepID=A0A1H3LE66_9FIRM|nr:ComF family protein [Tindallia californiensis]SDY62155.1 comF family protein [Tindallia californiensis]